MVFTPGQVVSAVTLLENNPKPSVDQVRHALEISVGVERMITIRRESSRRA